MCVAGLAAAAAALISPMTMATAGLDGGCRENGGRVRCDRDSCGMAARFIGVDRDQVFLMPPSLRDWVPEGHLVWTVLDSVEELDLSAFYVAYRADGHGR